MRVRHLLALGLAACVPACYSYVPGDGAALAVGSHVSIELNAEGRGTLGRELGADPTKLDGVVLRADSIGLDLAVRDVENGRGDLSRWNGERVELPSRLIAAVHERRLSVAHTGVLAGLEVGGLFAGSRLLGGSGTLSGAAGGAPGSTTR